MTAALRFFVLIEVLGLAATPLAAVAFARLPGCGVAFAKPLGLLLATWLVWMAGLLGVVHQSLGLWIGVVALLVLAGGPLWWGWGPRVWGGILPTGPVLAGGAGVVALPREGLPGGFAALR